MLVLVAVMSQSMCLFPYRWQRKALESPCVCHDFGWRTRGSNHHAQINSVMAVKCHLEGLMLLCRIYKTIQVYLLYYVRGRYSYRKRVKDLVDNVLVSDEMWRFWKRTCVKVTKENLALLQSWLQRCCTLPFWRWWMSTQGRTNDVAVWHIWHLPYVWRDGWESRIRDGLRLAFRPALSFIPSNLCFRYV
jgi:hypothetical protein